MTHILSINISGIDDSAYLTLYDRATNRRKQRADRYLRQEDRIRCIVAGALLHLAVQKAVGIAEYKIETNPFGKPMVKGAADFHFNLSHSGQWVVIAYGSSPVGIDVERICWDSGKENLARRYFTADEQDYVFGQEPQRCAERFFEIWTAKESYLKYIGTGLRKALDSFSVLQINVPNRLAFQPDIGYSLCLWSEEERVDKTVISVSELLEVI
jgi:4'-phosphopantetheinyl transferase